VTTLWLCITVACGLKVVLKEAVRSMCGSPVRNCQLEDEASAHHEPGTSVKAKPSCPLTRLLALLSPRCFTIDLGWLGFRNVLPSLA